MDSSKTSSESPGWALFVVAGLLGGIFAGAFAVYQAATGEALDVEPFGVGPGFVDSIENVECDDAGTFIRASCGQSSLSCECDQATYFESTTGAVPLTGRAETNFDANTRWVQCRSQANAVCDCWALCSTPPD